MGDRELTNVMNTKHSRNYPVLVYARVKVWKEFVASSSACERQSAASKAGDVPTRLDTATRALDTKHA